MISEPPLLAKLTLLVGKLNRVNLRSTAPSKITANVAFCIALVGAKFVEKVGQSRIVETVVGHVIKLSSANFG